MVGNTSITALEVIFPYLLEFCVCDSEIEPHTKSGDVCSAKKKFLILYYVTWDCMCLVVQKGHTQND